jgi:hypothetical protein
MRIRRGLRSTVVAVTLIIVAGAGLRAQPGVPYGVEGEFLVFMNVQPVPANVTLEYRLPGKPRLARHSFTLKPASRHTLSLADAPYLRDATACFRAVSDVPIAAGRIAWFKTGDVSYGGDEEYPGAPAPSTTWLFAEGFVAPDNDTWIVLTNPLEAAAQVTLEWFRDGGPLTVTRHAVPPLEQVAVRAGARPEIGTGTLSVRLTSDVPVLAERVLQWGIALGGPSWVSWVSTGITSSPGFRSSSRTWYFPELKTGDTAEAYLCLLNPNDADASVTVQAIARPAGSAASRASSRGEAVPVRPGEVAARETLRVPRRSRFTWDVHRRLPRFTGALAVESDLPVVAELPNYWDAGGQWHRGGVARSGAPAPSTDWFIPEGYEGPPNELSLVLFNPLPVPARVKYEGIRDGGEGNRSGASLVPPLGIVSIPLRAPAGVDGRLGFHIDADSPIVAAEVTVRSAGDISRALLYNSMGVTALSDVWYLPRAFDPSRHPPAAGPATAASGRSTGEF